MFKKPAKPSGGNASKKQRSSDAAISRRTKSKPEGSEKSERFARKNDKETNSGDRRYGRKPTDRPYRKTEGRDEPQKEFGDRRYSRKPTDRPHRKTKDRDESNKEFGDKRYGRKPADKGSFTHRRQGSESYAKGRNGFAKPNESEHGNEPKARFSKGNNSRFGSGEGRGAREMRAGSHYKHDNFERKRIRKPAAPPPLADDSKGIRLNKYLGNAGIAARRDADKLITAGLVRINGEVITQLGTKVMPGDVVSYNGQKVVKEAKMYVLLNKPKDYITTTEDENGRKTVMDLIKGVCSERVMPVGRLDRNTTGLLLLTNDGDLAERLMHPRYEVRKVYIATTDKPMPPAHLRQLADGVELEDGFVKPDAVSYHNTNDKNTIFIELHSGKNHVVHRMFESLGYLLDKLDRTAYAGLTKTGLKRGECRLLTDKEVNLLRRG